MIPKMELKYHTPAVSMKAPIAVEPVAHNASNQREYHLISLNSGSAIAATAIFPKYNTEQAPARIPMADGTRINILKNCISNQTFLIC